MRTRKDPKDRAAEVLDAAVLAAERYGILKMTRDQIAAIAGVSPALVSARLGSMSDIRHKVIRVAVKTEREKIVAMGLALRDRSALNAPEDLKQRAMAHLLK